MGFSVSSVAQPVHINRVRNRGCGFVAHRGFRRVLGGSRLLRCGICINGCCKAPGAPILSTIRNKCSVVVRISMGNTGSVHRGLPRTIDVFVVPPSCTRLEHHLDKEKARDRRMVRREVRRSLSRVSHTTRFSCVIMGSSVRGTISSVVRIVSYDQLDFGERGFLVSKILGGIGSWC